MSNHDDIYRQIALQYAEEWGNTLQKEAHALGDLKTPGLDHKVNAAIKRRRQARRQWVAAAIAACAVLIFALSPTAIWDRAAIDNLPAESSATTGSFAPSAIPLGFDLPRQFVVEDVTIDRGQTIYTLADSLNDPVVLTLEREARPLDTASMTAIELEGQTVYAMITADYSLIAFDNGGLRYVMTCRYDVNTLLILSREILI